MTSSASKAGPLVTAPPGPLSLLFCDDSLVVVNKPSGLSVHRGLSNERDYVLTRVRDQLGVPVFLVHRLDRATSGALLLVRDVKLVPPLQAAFQAREIEKKYLALTRGVMPERIHVDYAIPKAEGSKERVEAQTTFTRVAVYRDRYSLVLAEPETGRFHQIRRHLSHLRHPIIGDTNYGDRKENRFFRQNFGLLRLALHAQQLAFPHPITNERIATSAPLPDDLREAFSAMNLWSQ